MKLRQHIGSIVFVVAAVVSGTFAVLDGRADRARPGSEARVLPDFDRAKLTGIEVERGAERLLLTRSGAQDAFVMASPAEARTDPASVDQLVAALEQATIARPVPDVSASGAPRARVTLTFGANKSQFVLAEPAPVPEGAAYVDLQDGRRVVVRRELAAELLRPFDAYRDRSLLTSASGDISRIEVRTRQGLAVAVRDGDRGFRVPNGPRIARDVLDRWLAALPELRATSFLPASVFTDSAESFDLSTFTPDGRKETVRFGGACPADDREALAQTATKVVACVPKSASAAFLVAGEALADRRLFGHRPDEAAEVTVEAGTNVLSLARVGGGFRQRRPDARELDGAEVEAASALLGRILSAEGAIVAPPGVPAGAAPLSISLVKAGSDVAERVDIVDVGDASFAHRQDDDVWLSISKATRRALEPPVGGVRAPWLLARGFSPDALKTLAIRCGPTAATLTRTREAGFAFESPRGLPVDGARTLELLDMLAKTRGRDATSQPGAPAANGKPAPDACSVALTWEQDGGAAETSITLVEAGADAGAEIFARRDGEAAVFTVPFALKAALSEPLVDRGAIALASLASEPITASRKGSAVTFDAATEASVRSALRTLRAVRVERLGAPPPAQGFGSAPLEIRVTGDGGSPLVYRFVAAEDGVRARRNDLDVTFVLDRDHPLRAVLEAGQKP